jgi:hypothetical protein
MRETSAFKPSGKLRGKEKPFSCERISSVWSQIYRLAFSTLSIHVHLCQGGPPPSTLSSRPPRRAVGLERTRISYIAVPLKATYAAFRKESHKNFANAASWTGNPGERKGETCSFTRTARKCQ